MIQFLKSLAMVYKEHSDELIARRHYRRVNWAGIRTITGMDKLEEELGELEPKVQQQALLYSEPKLLAEGRFRFLNTLKSVYWHCIEEYQASGASVRILRECVDRALDDPEYPLSDWETVIQYLEYEWYFKIIYWCAKVPLIGRLFKWVLMRHLSFCYETAVIYIIAHFEAETSFGNISSDKSTTEKIRQLSREEIRKATSYIKSRISLDYPEIATAVQARMASMFLLNRLREHTQVFLEKGLIDERECNKIMDIIDSRIYTLNIHPPEAALPDIKEEAKSHKALKEIIETPEGWEQLVTLSSANTAYDGRILFQANTTDKNVYAIIKGKVLERMHVDKASEYPISVMRGGGSLLGLYEMLTQQETHLTECIARSCLVYLAIPWEVFAKFVDTNTKKTKLWKVIAARVIQYNFDNFPILHEFTTEDLERLVAICKCVAAESGEKVDSTDGIIFLHGEVQKVRFNEGTLAREGLIKGPQFIKPFHGFIQADTGCIALKLPSELRDLWTHASTRGRIRALLSATEPGQQLQKGRSLSVLVAPSTEEVQLQINTSKQFSEDRQNCFENDSEFQTYLLIFDSWLHLSYCKVCCMHFYQKLAKSIYQWKKGKP
eukprot:TRINITY_DN339_c0_g1_i2.p2 TRINITY_DN339_c0_g1~~TRINITY_DN339_c0_g1_i2.p2  ORF type:complete len:608 (-),score=58.49 TRINITY_DN339_c0_g1_i2:42-1865(-)